MHLSNDITLGLRRVALDNDRNIRENRVRKKLGLFTFNVTSMSTSFLI